jgi:glycosyltransferase involved in cell wall biosynthesis
MKPRVSIGLPVYNGERYLALTIENHLAQSFGDFELIVSDNASTDATADICRQFAARDRRIRYVRQPHNVGVTRNFNGVVAHATAPYFKWSSADDLVAPDLLAKCVAVLDGDSSIVLVHSRTSFIDADGNILPREAPALHLMEEQPSARLNRLWERLAFCNAQYGVMRRESLCRMRLFGPYVGSDLCFLAELSLHGKFYEIEEHLLHRRLHGHAASSLAPEELVAHYGLRQGQLVLYYWRLLGEHASMMLRAPISLPERMRAFWLLAKRTRWQRRELTDEIGFLFRYLLGRPYPILGAGRHRDL